MNERCERRGPNLGLLLLIPAAVMIAKGAHRHGAMGGAAWGPGPGVGRRGHGHGSPFWRGGVEGDGPATFIAAWHTRAHQGTDPVETATA